MYARVERCLRAGAVAVVCGAVLATAACSGGTDNPDPPPPVPPTAVSPPTIPAPTAAELNADLARAFDETVPAAEKVVLVQGAQNDPQLVDQVVAAAQANKVSAQVTEVTDLGDGTVAATTVVTLDGQPGPESIFTFVAEDGVWKLTQDNACTIVAMAGLHSPACA